VIGAAALCIAAIAILSAAATAGSDGVEAGDGWAAELSDGHIEMRALGRAVDGRTVVRVRARLCTYDLALTAWSDAGDRFEVSTDNAAPGSTDVTEGSIEVSGRVRGDDIVGQVEVDVRTYDNAGDTGSCELDERYTATPKRRARGYDRVSVVAELEADELAATSDAAYAALESRRIVRIAADGSQTWSVETPDLLALAASDDAVWWVRRGAVERLDPATGATTASLALDGLERGFAEAEVAEDGSLWVASAEARSVMRIAADGQSVRSTTEVDGRPSVLAPRGADVIVAVSGPATESDPSSEGLVRIGATGETGTQITVDDVADLAVSGDVLWVRPLTGRAEARDLTTLEAFDPARRIRDIDAMAAAGDLLWVTAGDDLFAFSPRGRRVARIPDVAAKEDFTLLAGARDTLWLDPLSTLVRLV
jgi:hypothetical protein